jgi:hypothetical protein
MRMKLLRPKLTFHFLAAPFMALFVIVGTVVVLQTHAATAIIGDINGDGTVNVSDLSLLLANWSKTTAADDLNKDGMVNIFDLSLLLSHWGQTATPTPTPTPAPTPAGNIVSVSTAAALQTALSNAKPGDVITLAAGTYSGNFTATANGTATSPITLTGSRNAILDGGALTSGYTLHLGSTDSTATVSYWKFTGFTVTGAQKGIVWDNVQHSVISGVLVQQIGEEGIHLRDNSSDNIIQNSTVTKTGQDTQAYGEGIYIGTAVSNWGSYSQGSADHSNRNQITGNTISYTGAENLDIKEGTHTGIISGNTLDGSGMCWDTSADCNYADSSIDMKGEGWTVQSNTIAHIHAVWSDGSQADDGIQVHVISGTGSEGSGTNNLFASNTLSDIAGYGFNIASGATGTVVKCSNTVTGAGSGFGNVTCTP